MTPKINKNNFQGKLSDLLCYLFIFTLVGGFLTVTYFCLKSTSDDKLYLTVREQCSVGSRDTCLSGITQLEKSFSGYDLECRIANCKIAYKEKTGRELE